MGAVCSNAKTPRGSFAAPGEQPKHTAATSEVIVTRTTARPSSSKRPPDEHSSAPAAPDASPSRVPIAPPRATLDPDVTSQTPPVTSPTPAMRASNGGAGGIAGGGNAKKKRVAIAVENVASVDDIDVVAKDERVRELILGATESNTLFEGLDFATRCALCDVMTETRVAAGADVIVQGATGDDARHFYVLESGTCEVKVRRRDPADGKPVMTEPERTVATYAGGDSFGELALLYGAPRAATIRASKECKLWSLDRAHYVAIKRRFQEALAERVRDLVESVNLFQGLSPEHKATIADALKCEVFEKDDVIISEGETGDKFYVVSSGEVSVYVGGADSYSTAKSHRELTRLTAGASFGEKALINDDVRGASVKVVSDRCELFHLDRARFNALLGSYGEIWRWLSLRRVPVLSSVSDAEITELVSHLDELSLRPGELVYDVGDVGDCMYVAERGEFLITDADGKRVDLVTDGGFFGERSLMGSERRAMRAEVANGGLCAASAPAAKLLRLNRRDLENLLGEGLAAVTTQSRLRCLQHVALLESLSDAQRTTLVSYLQPRQYAEGEVVFRQGDPGDKFYIVETGNVAIHRERESTTSTNASRTKHEVLKLVTRGEYFGELALLSTNSRAATATVERGGAFILSLTKEDFDTHMGSLAKELSQQAKDEYGVAVYDDRVANDPARSLAAKAMTDFKVKAVLGVGAFGKVLLCRHPSSAGVFAVKQLSKAQIIAAQLQHHVRQERDVMKDCDSPYLVRLVATFQDPRMLYMCMETVMGGELFNHLSRVGGSIPERDARFYAACVVLAFQYLQNKHYIYRDLKPENLLIDGKGYVKVADFGFAKRLLPGEKTYTLCGTPEYMSPELYRQSGHNKAVDWWALGVLIYEMVVGAPPFYSPNADSTDQMRRILAAKYSFPEGVSPAFKDVVRRFLSVNAVHRLGSLKGGVKDVKLHPWFKSTDWIAMTRREGKPPFVPPLRGDDDHSCFDEYDPRTPHPGEEFDRKNATSRSKKREKEQEAAFAGF